MTGQDLESYTLWYLKQHYHIFDTVGTELDRTAGTDFIIKHNGKEYRVDLTLNFYDKQAKSKTEEIGRYSESSGGLSLDIQYGLRTNNGVRNFDIPVLVIGINDVSGDLEKEKDWAIKAYQHGLQNIVEKGLAAYDENQLIPEIQKDPFYIGQIRNQTQNMQLAAVKAVSKEEAPELAWELLNPPTNVQRAICEKNGLAIEAFIDPPESVQLAAIRENPAAYELIDNPAMTATVECKKIKAQINKTNSNISFGRFD